MPVDGVGTTLTFGTSGAVTSLVSVSVSGTLGFDPLETTTLGTTGYKTFMPSELGNPGTLSYTVQYTGADIVMPALGTAEQITIDISGAGSGATFVAATGFVTGVSFEVSIGAIVTATVEMQLSGSITE